MIDEIKKWVEEFVSVHNDELGAIPCPFAKQAMLNNTINYISTNTIGHTLQTLQEDWVDNYEVVVLYTKTELYTPGSVRDIVEIFNEAAKTYDLVALEDHPNDPEVINSVTMNFGKCILILVQRLSKLNKASEMLKKQGYYDNWSQENIDDVVTWRN